jgi:MSHA pilin protein MshA
MNSKGFTLIELVVVIVVLGILAITAVPKYINLKADAQTATLEGVKAAMQGASALVYGKSLVKGNQGISLTNNPRPSIILTDGTELNIHHGYPLSEPNDWEQILDLDSNDFRLSSDANSVLMISPVSEGFFITSGSDCIVTYQQATSINKPVITVNPCI